MKRLLLFAGTTEGRQVAEALAGRPVEITACVATAYGRELLSGLEGITLRAGRMEAGEMAALMKAGGFGRVVDATHPYAAEATRNIRAAAGAAGLPCLRLVRENGEAGGEGLLRVDDAPAAARALAGLRGRALLSTGSKELAAFTALPGWRERLYVRLLPHLDSLEHCLGLGFKPGHILAMQGPFSAEFNLALLRQWGISLLVTKDGGRAGGLPEKLKAARSLGVRTILIKRPPEGEGYTLEALLAALNNWLEDME